MNVHDSEQMAALLAPVGYKMTDNLKLADLILLNTCSIREKAAHKVYSKLGRISKLKRTKSGIDYWCGRLSGTATGNKIS